MVSATVPLFTHPENLLTSERICVGSQKHVQNQLIIKMELFAEKANGFELLPVFTKISKIYN